MSSGKHVEIISYSIKVDIVLQNHNSKEILFIVLYCIRYCNNFSYSYYQCMRSCWSQEQFLAHLLFFGINITHWCNTQFLHLRGSSCCKRCEQRLEPQHKKVVTQLLQLSSSSTAVVPVTLSFCERCFNLEKALRTYLLCNTTASAQPRADWKRF